MSRPQDLESLEGGVFEERMPESHGPAAKGKQAQTPGQAITAYHIPCFGALE